MVSIWKTKSTNLKPRPERLKNMPTRDIKEWLGTEIMLVGAAFDKWAYSDSEKEEVTQRIEAVAMMWDEILERE